MKALLFSFLFVSALYAEKIDPHATSYGVHEKKKTEVYDFTGTYPELTSVLIDAKRKMRVEMLMTGSYPLLDSFQYIGSFGTLDGKVTGEFPLLKKMNFACGSSSVTLDFTAPWEEDCEITVDNNFGEVTLILPKHVALTIETKTGVSAKIVAADFLTKKKGVNPLGKRYFNERGKKYFSKKERPKEDEVHLHFIVRLKEGTLKLL